MQRTLIALITILLILKCLAMNKSDIIPDAIVRFHWSESNKRKNYTEDLRQRIEALDGELATIAEPPLGPFWFHNRRRIVIQSVEYPNIIVAVKRRNLKLEQPIKFHVFHAESDILSSNHYLRKEMDIINAQDHRHDVVMTVHNGTESLGRPCHFYIGHFETEDPFISRLMWFSRDSIAGSHRHVERILNRLMDSVKDIICELLREKYHNIGLPYSDEMKNLSGCEPSFLTNLQCQFRAIHHRNGSFIDMDWLKPNSVITGKWLVQGMMFIHSEFHNRIKEVWNHMITSPMTTNPKIGPGTIRVIEVIKERDELEFEKSLDGLRQLMNQEGTTSRLMTGPVVRSLLYGLSKIPEHVAFQIQSVREVAVIGNIGLVIEGAHQNTGVPQGSSIAFVVPGNLMPTMELLQQFLPQAMKKLGWEFCEWEIHEI